MLNSFYTVFAVMFFTFLDYPNGVQVAVWLVLTDDVSECLWGLHYIQEEKGCFNSSKNISVAVWLFYVPTDDGSECLWGLHVLQEQRGCLTHLKTSQLQLSMKYVQFRKPGG